MEVIYKPRQQYRLLGQPIVDRPDAAFVVAGVTEALDIHMDTDSVGDIIVFFPSAEHVEYGAKSIKRLLMQRGYDVLLPDADAGSKTAMAGGSEVPLKLYRSNNVRSPNLEHTPHQVVIVSLHGGVEPELQLAAFIPSSAQCRKIVFSTVVAETSVTIDGIRFVVDTGLAKEIRYDGEKKMTLLEVGPVSQSSAKQRAGRAGRTAPGRCIRLYSEEDYQTLERSRIPEIKRTSLTLTLLKIFKAGVSNPAMFPFIEIPDPALMADSLSALELLDAIEKKDSVGNFTLTEVGEVMSCLPIEPALSKLLLESFKQGLKYEALLAAAYASVCSSQSPFKYQRVDRNLNPSGAAAAAGLGDDHHPDDIFVTAEKIEASKALFISRGGEIATGLKLLCLLNTYLDNNLFEVQSAKAFNAAVGADTSLHRPVPRFDKDGIAWCNRHCVRVKLMKESQDCAKEIHRSLVNNVRYFPKGPIKALVEALLTDIKTSDSKYFRTGIHDPTFLQVTTAKSVPDDVDKAMIDAKAIPNEIVNDVQATPPIDNANNVNDTINAPAAEIPPKGYFCTPCKKACNSLVQFDQHKNSSGHRVKLAELGVGDDDERINSHFICSVCTVGFASGALLEQHNLTTEHLAKFDATKKLSVCFNCAVCNIACNSATQLEAHNNSAAHRGKTAQAQIQTQTQTHNSIPPPLPPALPVASAVTAAADASTLAHCRYFEAEIVPLIHSALTASLFTNCGKLLNTFNLEEGVYIISAQSTAKMSAYSISHLEAALVGRNPREVYVVLFTGVSEVKVSKSLNQLSVLLNYR